MSTAAVPGCWAKVHSLPAAADSTSYKWSFVQILGLQLNTAMLLQVHFKVMDLLESQSWCFTGQFALLVAPVSQQPGVKPPMLPVAKKTVKGTWLRSNTAANLSLQVRELPPLEQPS